MSEQTVNFIVERYDNEELAEANEQLAMMVARLHIENGKLRELVHILAYCMSEDRDCDLCALNGADMPAPRISDCDALPGMLREMGLEVVG